MTWLRRLFTYNVGSKAISLIVAICLWFIVLGSRTVEITKDVPVEIIPPEGLVLANEVPEAVTFRLSGPKAFIRAILDRQEDPIRVNLAQAEPGTATYRFFSDNISLPIGVKVLAIQPKTIQMRLERVRHKTVPVKVGLVGAPPEGFKVLETVVTPSEVRIEGAKSNVAKIQQMDTRPVNVDGLTETLEEEARFDLSGTGVRLTDTPPRVRVVIRPVSANFRLRNVRIRTTPSVHKAQLTRKTVTAFVRATPEALKSLDPSQVYAEVNLQGKEKGRHRLPVHVVLPNGIALVRVVPEEVDVLLQ